MEAWRQSPGLFFISLYALFALCYPCPMADTPSFPLKWDARSSEASAYDWITNSFDRGNPEALDVVPIQNDEPWETIPMLAHLFKPRLILGLFPAFLQIDTRYHHAIRALGMPVCTIAEEQIKVAASLVKLLRVGGIIVMQSALESFKNEIEEYAPDAELYYQVVLAPDERPLFAPNTKNIFYELHLVPGVVGLFQCAHANREKNVFHPNERFVWEFEHSRAWVSDRKEGRFSKAEIPQSVFVRGIPCPCGRTSLALQ